MGDFADFAKALGAAILEIDEATSKGVEKGCRVLEEASKALIGTYDSPVPWPPLKEATVARKATGDSPLLETGALRDSISYAVSGNEGFVGTNDPKAAFHEFGTSRMPARPFLGGAAVQKEKEVAEIIGASVHSAILRTKSEG